MIETDYPEGAAWRAARVVGWLSRDFDAEERRTLIDESLAEGARGELL